MSGEGEIGHPMIRIISIRIDQIWDLYEKDRYSQAVEKCGKMVDFLRITSVDRLEEDVTEHYERLQEQIETVTAIDDYDLTMSREDLRLTVTREDARTIIRALMKELYRGKYLTRGGWGADAKKEDLADAEKM